MLFLCFFVKVSFRTISEAAMPGEKADKLSKAAWHIAIIIAKAAAIKKSRTPMHSGLFKRHQPESNW